MEKKERGCFSFFFAVNSFDHAFLDERGNDKEGAPLNKERYTVKGKESINSLILVDYYYSTK